MDKSGAYYTNLRTKLNEIFKELQQAPEKYKLGYWHTVPSILNAYREGDISFDKACSLLQMKVEDLEKDDSFRK